MTRLWGTVVTPDAFRLLAGEADLVDYQPDSVHHLFCQTFRGSLLSVGRDAELGSKFIQPLE